MTQKTQSILGSPQDWRATVSGISELKLSMTPGASADGAASAGTAGASAAAGPSAATALRMDFDFKGGKGFVVARRALARAMPEDYALRFRLRGRGPVNNLELKLVDTSGQNVWRYVIKDLKPPARWKQVVVQSRDIEFAWGPASGSALAQLGAIEIAIVAGEGGEGTLWVGVLAVEDLVPAAPPVASASSELTGFEAARGLSSTGWKPLAEDPHPWISIDANARRLFGGLVIDWLERAPAKGFRISSSGTGRRWKTLHVAARAAGKRSYVYLPGLEARFIRLEIREPSAGAVLHLQSFEFSRSIHAFWHHIADAEARAWHPRWLHREQSLWTPVGLSRPNHCALLNDDGMAEVGEGSFSVEPMLWIDGGLVAWSDNSARQVLREDWMPVPAVIWETEGWRLRVLAEATVSGATRLSYHFDNLTHAPCAARLFLVIRPFQVTPPWQSFRKMGGVSRIADLAWTDGRVRVNEATVLEPATAPAGFGALTFDEGFIADSLGAGRLPPNSSVHDEFGFASGALEFDLSIGARKSCVRTLNCAPLAQQAAATSLVGEAAFDWAPVLPAAQWQGNGWAVEAIRAALTATAQVLITRNGPALQPGPRRYTRSWIRDGAMMGAALLRMRHAPAVRDFIEWYAPHQRADGFVPCCVDSEGVDWLVEHDSHGELVALIADYHRFTRDHEFLKRCWNHVERAVSYIEQLLDENGLLPISVSHEGYLAQPVHSYWDDFWALKGVRDAVRLARALGQEDLAGRWESLAARVAASVYRSIERTRTERKLDFIPGSVEWADFDPTATANALYLLDVPEGLDRKAIARTFEMYLTDWRAKRAGTVASSNYTPYEIRIIGALVRLGQRADALELLRFFLSDRRPLHWNQWPEISWRDRHAPAHLGDLPHTWIAAEYVLALRSLFAYEREADDTLVLGAGLAPEWIEGAGVRVERMPTLFGDLSYTVRRVDEHTIRFEVSAGVAAKFLLRPPLAAPISGVMVNGREYKHFDGDSVVLEQSPAEVTCTTV